MCGARSFRTKNALTPVGSTATSRYPFRALRRASGGQRGAVIHRVMVMPVERGIVGNGDRSIRAEHGVVFEDDDSRRTGRRRLPDPVVVAVKIEAEEVGFACTAVSGDQIVDVVAGHPCRHGGNGRKTPTHLGHVIGIAVDHQP